MDNTSKNRVLAVQVRSSCVAYKELASIGVWASIGHAKDSFVRMWVPDLLIGELFSINADSSSSIACSRVTTLHHEVRYNPVEAVAFVGVLRAFFTRAESSEILTSFWHVFTKDFKDDSSLLKAFLALVTNSDFEICLNIRKLKVR
jgi:hypothetical protein